MTATTTTHHVDLTTSGIVLVPDRTVVLRWTDDAEQVVLTIARGRLEAHLAALIGRPVDTPVDLDVDLAGPRGASLLASVRFLARELERPGGIADAPPAREQLEAFVMTQLLLAARSSWSDELGAAEPARASRLEPVLAHMQAHADQPLTPGDLARVGCMSVRALHATFRDELGVSPMAHLRRIRLDNVYAALLRGLPQGIRIGDVAARWGFFHASRFARQYQERFGELPSETLATSSRPSG